MLLFFGGGGGEGGGWGEGGGHHVLERSHKLPCVVHRDLITENYEVTDQKRTDFDW